VPCAQCCSEYSIARFSGRIAEKINEAGLRHIEAARHWPTNVAEYSSMMADDAAVPVKFTMKGDRDVVKFIVRDV
jgi:hypothetical protein